MKFVHGISLLSAAAILTVGGPAGAVQTPPALAGRPALEVAQGDPVRVAGLLDWHSVPAQHRKAWNRLQKAMGARTLAVWDHDTGVVRRIWGAGIDAPGTLADPAAAERTARQFLAEHLALLAPGAAASDFALVANHVRAGMRTLGFAQRRGGLDVIGGQVSFRFKNDRLFMIGSEALPHAAAPTARAVTDDAAAAAALAWLARDTTTTARVTGVAAPRLLPLIRSGRVAYATVLTVVADDGPRGRWSVFIDVATGTPVARAQTLRFASGTVKYNAPVRGPAGMRKDYPAYEAQLTVNNQATTATATGLVNWNGNNAAMVTARARGDQWIVDNQSGAEATQALNLQPNGTVTWNAANNEQVDAQVVTFVHANEVMNYVRAIDPANPFHNDQFDAVVNIPDACNAYYDGQSINFFRQQGGCNNTGRIADIVYHEFGHGVHEHAIIQGVGAFDGALSEGVSDYLCTTITGDPAMAVEFFLGDPNPLRHLDPPNEEKVWPDDISGFDTHATGEIIGGALWDLRKALVAEQGPGAVAVVDNLYYEAISRATDIPTMYFETIAADDDDGDLANGTPNFCQINAAYALHGLYSIGVDVSGPGVAVPQLDGYEVTAALSGGSDLCGGDGIESADLIWRLREDPNTGGQIAMDITGDAISGTIPKQAPGTVVQYQIQIGFQQANDREFPDNRADPFYEFYVGAVEDIYCTDFETDPALDGWTHGLSQGQPSEGADDWMWAVPMAAVSSGDPQAAYDGTRAYGNDLGGGNYNGLYQAEKTNFTQSHVIDTTGYAQVRLQYRRWLTVEDGFYDRATIYANDKVAWQNLRTPDEGQASVHHTDREWRFHDVDLTPFITNDAVTLKYEIKTDEGLEMGGWTLDALCVVGLVDAPASICGDEIVTAPEHCDDGASNSDSEPDACRTDCTLPACGDGVVDAAEDCDDGNTNDGDACPADCSAVVDTGDDTGPVTTDDTGPVTTDDTGTGDDGDLPTTSGDDGNPPSTPTEDPGDDASSSDPTTSTTTAGLDDEGCGCRQDAGAPASALFGLALLGLRRRRR